MSLDTVSVPGAMRPTFSEAESYVKNYFKNFNMSPENGTIEIDGERYILVRTASMSVHFLDFIKEKYPILDEEDSIEASSKVLFEMAHAFGMSDAKSFHEKTKVTDPLAKLSTGPVHFAFTGWAYVDIDERSNPSIDDNFCLIYKHPKSFEADSWIKLRGKTKFCTCFMNAGYSSGWCQESFGLTLEAKEITCRARGDEHCQFVMARPHKLNEFIKTYSEI